MPRKENCLISIIIPAYNVEKYIDKCMTSILQQTYQNLEIIIVDDGSVDNTPEMCDKYANADPRVKVYHQKNSGQAVARNKAYDSATGEYIMYIDSDDYVSTDYVEKLFESLIRNGADIAQCYGQKFWNDGRCEKVKIDLPEEKIYTASAALEEFCYQRNFCAGPCAKIIHRDLLKGLKYPPDTGYEDLAIMYQVLGRAKKIVLIPEILYFYRQHKASTMHTAFSNKKVDRIHIAEQLKSYVLEYYPELSTAVENRYFLANIQLLMDLPFSVQYKALRECVRRNIKKSRNLVISDKKAKASLRGMAVCSYLGIPVLMMLGRLYKRINS